jgi:hypothetical protein
MTEVQILATTPLRLNPQVVSNVGLYFVCYKLSLLGWNVMPTARNARGIDVVAYSQDATRTCTIQVKALSKRAPVPLGPTLDKLLGDFFIVCSKIASSPECFVLTPSEVRSLAHRGEKDGRISHWLQPREYEAREYRDAWHRLEPPPPIEPPKDTHRE